MARGVPEKTHTQKQTVKHKTKPFLSPNNKLIRTTPMEGGEDRRNSIAAASELLPPQQNSLRNPIHHQPNSLQIEQEQLQQQPPMSDAEDAVNEFDDEEGEDHDDQSGDGGGENDGDEEQRPQLADGFYVVEAVRRKRIRKGKPQYLIKWRGWPEATNTWEPMDNLSSIPDVIEAFEESLRDRKQRSSRKHKLKHSVVPTPQSKNKQKEQLEQSCPPASYDIPTVRITIIEEPLSVPSVPDANLSNRTENNVGGTGNNGTTNPSNDTGLLIVSKQIGERQERNEVDAHLNELTVPSSSNQDRLGEFAIHIQEARPTEEVSPVEVRPADGILKVDGTEPIRVGRLVGARRRKSCAVKRFKKESNSALRNDALGNTTADGVVVGEDAIKNMNGLDSNNIVDAPPSISAITKIIKTVNYSTSTINDTEDVSVNFLVRRSDGEEVVVDNKYLKENNPLLLINFYEQHVRYNRSSE
ncbi:hypothetical protein L6452_30263 [Arctium lappa]|uniref:Uncharacterized protein n=1 Tax=Arctium lappa TaxID=4217 RepID=A0ACB8ZJ76_ARCLA|nr:hypothetical protein L6452_30263 [Arctium lappa]